MSAAVVTTVTGVRTVPLSEFVIIVTTCLLARLSTIPAPSSSLEAFPSYHHHHPYRTFDHPPLMSSMASSSSSSAPSTMPAPTADLATTWKYLEEGVDHIMTKLQTGVSYSKYMSLYTVSYNYCTSSKMHNTGDSSTLGQRSKSCTATSLTRELLNHLLSPLSGCESDGIGFVQQSYTVLCITLEVTTRREY